MKKRPMLWILGVWIVGELMAEALGIALVPETGLDRTMAGRNSAVVRVSGCVRQIHRTSSGYSYVLADNQVLIGSEVTDTHDILVYTKEREQLKIGQRWIVTGTLSPFSMPGNPGEFDLRAYYRSQGIDFSLREAGRRAENLTWDRIGQALFLLREHFSDAVAASVGEEDAGVLNSVLLGDRSALDGEIRDLYQMGGIAHLLAVSGLHVTLLGTAVRRLLRRCGVPVWAAVPLCLSAVAAYIRLTGSGSSAVRAGIMFGLFLGAGVVGRSYDMLSALAAAALVLLWQHPLLLWQSGFQLSAAALLGIGWILPQLNLRRGGAVSASAAVQLAAMPVLASMNGVLPLFSPMTNALILPGAGLLLGFAGGIGLTGTLAEVLAGAGGPALLPGKGIRLLGMLFSLGARGMLALIRRLTERAVRVPGYLFVTGTPALWQMVLYYVLLLAGLRRLNRENREKTGTGRDPDRGRGRRRFRGDGELLRWGRVLLLYFLLAGVLHRLPVTEPLQITALDVGQGDSIFLRSEGRTCLIDGGSSSLDAVGRRRILPYLRSQGISCLDLLVLTHGDGDHYNGLEELMRDPALRIGCFALTKTASEDPELQGLLETAEENRIPIRHLGAGMNWMLGGAACSCLYPTAAEEQHFGKEDKNDTSLVIRLELGGFSALFTGDLGEEGEKSLLSREQPEPVDLLKAGHHGSRYSSTADFLKALQPEEMVFSCGAGNRYGHPHAETLRRAEEAGAACFATKDLGAVSCVVKKDGSRRMYGFRHK